MRVKWTPQATGAVRQTALYIRSQFGIRKGEQFIREVHEASVMLGNNPNIGKVEPLLADRPRSYRSLVLNHLNKIVYFIDNNHIEVVDFWDTRREPLAQAKQI